MPKSPGSYADLPGFSTYFCASSWSWHDFEISKMDAKKTLVDPPPPFPGPLQWTLKMETCSRSWVMCWPLHQSSMQQ